MRLVVLVAVLLGCRPDSATPPGEVAGVVVDGLTDAPLSGATLRTRDGRVSVTTDAAGRFTMPLPEGTHRLWLERDGYASGQRANVVVAAGERAVIDPRLFPLDPSDAAIDAYFARQPARRHLHPAHERPTIEDDDDVGVVRAAGGDPSAILPDTIRVWRSGGTPLQPTAANGWADRSCDAAAVVTELDREEYVKGVIPHEWFPSWHPEALRAGAITARTYAVNWARRGGRWDCADVDDGTVTQVYRDDRADATNEAVDATAGQVIMRSGSVFSTEYSAENSDPTEMDVAEPTCTGTDRFGHGRGMCQWGTHRWASGICANPPCDWSAFGGSPPAYDHVWMVEHYFPGACVAGEGVDVPPCAVIGAEGGIVDDAGPCFDAYGPTEYWRTESVGHDGGLHWTNAFRASAPSNWARWQLHFAAPGRYRVEVWVDDTFGVYDRARYEVAHAGGGDEVRVDQGAASGWVELGTWTFGETGEVRLLDNEDVDVAADQHIVADAVRLTPEGAPAMDGGVGSDAGTSTGTGLPRSAGGTPRESSAGMAEGCRASPAGGRPPFVLGLLVAGALALRRR